jgi:hypothetical protein
MWITPGARPGARGPRTRVHGAAHTAQRTRPPPANRTEASCESHACDAATYTAGTDSTAVRGSGSP